jgi:hypothetical protein
MSRRNYSLKRIYEVLGADERVTTWHLAICVGIFFLSQGGQKKYISTSRKELMALSKIRSIVTYHKYIRELVNFGYIDYTPSYHPIRGSLISLQLK